MKKRLILSVILTLILGIAPFFLMSIEVQSSKENKEIAQEELHNINENFDESNFDKR